MLAVGGALRRSSSFNATPTNKQDDRDDLQDDGGFAKLRLQQWLPPPRRQRRLRPPISDDDTAVGGKLQGIQGRPIGPIQDRGMTSKTRLVFVRHLTAPSCGLRFLPNSAHKSHRPTTNIRQQPTNKQTKSNHETFRQPSSPPPRPPPRLLVPDAAIGRLGRRPTSWATMVASLNPLTVLQPPTTTTATIPIERRLFARPSSASSTTIGATAASPPCPHCRINAGKASSCSKSNLVSSNNIVPPHRLSFQVYFAHLTCPFLPSSSGGR